MREFMKRPWEVYEKPFRMIGNLYFVGNGPASTHILDTGEGLIMIDSGYPQMLYLVLANMAELGFDYRDIKYIVHSHGHYDHLGATRALKELTGAKTFIGARDEDYANGKLDLTWARELGAEYYEAFQPDVLLNDGDEIKLGNTVIKCVATPGHTPGTMSFFFDVTEDGKTYKCAMFGGLGLNTLEAEWLEKNGVEFSMRDEYFASIKKVRDIHVDVTVGNHVGNNDTLGRAALLGKAEKNPFINENTWGDLLDWHKNALEQMIEDEKNTPNG